MPHQLSPDQAPKRRRPPKKGNSPENWNFFDLTLRRYSSMCGIHAAVSLATQIAAPESLSARLRRCLANRGPDHQGCVTVSHKTADHLVKLSFTSTVLSLRGDKVAEQPFVDGQSGSVLCWNGEAWKLGGRAIAGNDGQAVFQMLTSTRPDGGSALDLLRSIEGPFAFIYFDKPAGSVYFGRDRLGRRSLLSCDSGWFLLSSVAESTDAGWREVEADGIYEMRLDGDPGPRLVRHDWMTAGPQDLVSSLGADVFSLGDAHGLLVELTCTAFKHWSIQHGRALGAEQADGAIAICAAAL